MLRSLQYSTGLALKTVLRDYSTGTERVWNTVTPGFEAYTSANIANYGIATTEGSPGTYAWTVPASLAASTMGFEYEAITYQIAATNLATTDLPNSVWRDTFAWSGTTVYVASNTVPTTTTADGKTLITSGTGANQIQPDGTTGGVKLSATGLDAIAITDPGVVANQNTFPKRLIAVWRSIFGPSKLTATQLQYLADDGVTANATCAVNDNGVTQTKGGAS